MSNTTILNPTLYYTPNNSASFGKSLNICQGNKNPPQTPLKCDTHSHARAPNPPNQSSGSLVFIEHPHHHPRTANKDVCLYMRFSFPCAQTARHLMRGYTNSLYTLNASHTSHAGLAQIRFFADMRWWSNRVNIYVNTRCARKWYLFIGQFVTFAPRTGIASRVWAFLRNYHLHMSARVCAVMWCESAGISKNVFFKLNQDIGRDNGHIDNTQCIHILYGENVIFFLYIMANAKPYFKLSSNRTAIRDDIWVRPVKGIFGWRRRQKDTCMDFQKFV